MSSTRGATIGDWLDARTPTPPDALRDRIAQVLGPSAGSRVADAPSVLLEAAERLVRQVIEEGRESREGALDLLAADALVTYAFEAASADPDSIAERSRAAISLLAATGGA